jgi:hypothetical protein
MARTSLILLALSFASSLTMAACASAPPMPPEFPTPPPIAVDDGPIAVAVAVDAESLRPVADQQRERLRDIIDLAEHRELHENGPRMLKTAKEQSRVLDGIEGRIDVAMRLGSRDAEIDQIHEDLRRLSTRLDLLAETLR